jgi:hypothetical protein
VEVVASLSQGRTLQRIAVCMKKSQSRSYLNHLVFCVIVSVMANPNLYVDRNLNISNSSGDVWLKVCTAVDVGNSTWKICLLKSVTSEPRELTKEGVCTSRKYYL